MPQAEVLVDLAAVRANVKVLRAAAGSATLMAVVKAAGYGHGATQVARAALDAGAGWLGVCHVAEALDLREAGISAPILAWLTGPGTPWSEATAHRVDVSVGSLTALREAVAAWRHGRRARVHLEVDTGLGRGGATGADWPDLVAAAAAAQHDGRVHVVGVWTHLACAELLGDPSVPAQLARYRQALRTAGQYGLGPVLRHVANSAATLLCPAARLDLVRPGIAIYGVPPADGLTVALRPAMTLRTVVAEVVSDEPTGSMAVLPVGMRDGLPRTAGAAQVLIGRRRYRLSRRVGLDTTRVPVGSMVRAGDPVTVFGPGDGGEPTALDWGRWAGTLAHEVLTGVGNRVPRRFVR